MKKIETNRRAFLRSLGLITVGATAGASLLSACGGKPAETAQTADTTKAVAPPAPKELFFKISLAEWSLHKSLFEKKFTNLDFPGIAKNTYGISAVEYVNQ